MRQPAPSTNRSLAHPLTLARIGTIGTGTLLAVVAHRVVIVPGVHQVAVGALQVAHQAAIAVGAHRAIAAVVDQAASISGMIYRFLNE